MGPSINRQQALLDPSRLSSRVWDESGYLDLESKPEHPFAVLWFFMRLFYGSLSWPIVVANAIGWAWCMYAEAQSLDYGISLFSRLLTPTG